MNKVRMAFGVFMLGASVAVGQVETPKVAKAKPKTVRQLQQDLDDLSGKYDHLEKELADMKAAAERRDAELQQSQKKAQDLQTAIDNANNEAKQREDATNAAVTQNSQAVASLQSTVDDIRTVSLSTVDTIQTDQKRWEAPPFIPFMGAGLKPGGFAAAETVLRQRGEGADLNTAFASIPFSGQTAGKLSEFNATGRQSRLSLLVEGRLSNSTIRGYWEGDFLSAGTTSNDNQSNSYTFRQRQVWAQAELKSGWYFTGGQMWSLATEYRTGLLNLREAIPQTIDAQYTVGFTWERQYGFRVAKQIGREFWAGFAVEEPETANIGGHNLPALVYQQAGLPGGLYNPLANYSFNFAPDLIAKVAYDPKFGHFEIFSIGRFFRARAFPNAPLMLTTTSNYGPAPANTTVGAFTSKTAGGGVGANARVFLLRRNLEIAAHGMAGNGLGRYSSATLPDFTAHPDGTLELLFGGSALGSVEWHATRRLDLYGYYGGEFVKRAWYPTLFTVNKQPVLPTDPPFGQPIVGGYGAPTNIVIGCNTEVVPATSPNGGGLVPGSAVGCFADNRNIQEGSAGYWFRFYKGPKGTLQQGMQFSYLVRHTWQGVGSPANPVTGAPEIPGSPKATDGMWFTSFRYYLPQ
jgi:hypothetical protein